MVWDSVWPLTLRKPVNEFLCVGCLESRIGRQLTKEDFEPVPGMFMWKMSERLQSRVDLDYLGKVNYV